MVSSSKKKKSEKKADSKKPTKKIGKKVTKLNPVVGKLAPKPVSPAKPIPMIAKVPFEPSALVNEPPQREGAGFKVAVDRIEGETIIGDLIVVFPWTRETLLKHGLNLDVDEAGDIYMSLGAFAAIHGLKTESFIHELVEVSRQPPPPKPSVNPHPTPQIASAPAV
jgi:hypothetical protein